MYITEQRGEANRGGREREKKRGRRIVRGRGRVGEIGSKGKGGRMGREGEGGRMEGGRRRENGEGGRGRENGDWGSEGKGREHVGNGVAW